MKKITGEKLAALKRLSNKDGVIAALAIDQRGSLKKMIEASANEIAVSNTAVVEFKKIVSQELTPFSSSILLDPEYGLPAVKIRDREAGLLIAYEKTGYDVNEPGRLPDL